MFRHFLPTFTSGVLGLLLTVGANAQIPKQYLGLTIHSSDKPWPTVSFGDVRLWDTGTAWANLNPSSGMYDWSTLNQWMNVAQTHGVNIVYTFGRTPKWASSKPGDTSCSYGVGQCDPPNDLKSDGTGTNQHWKNFVSAIATHAAGRIKYWEMWNTPNDIRQWTGTPAQLVRMAKDAEAIVKSIDPTTRVLTPASGNYHSKFPDGACHTAKWLGQFFAAGGGPYVDIVAFHGYYTTRAEDWNLMVDCIRNTMATYGQSAKPLWDTEGGWGRETDLSDRNKQTAFLARYYLLHWSRNIARFYWYAWDDGLTGTLWTSSGGIRPAGIAYREVAKWLIGATMGTRCASKTNSTWTCVLTRPGGYQGLVVWNASTSITFTAPSQYRTWRDLNGNTFTLSGNGSVTIGAKPILLEN